MRTARPCLRKAWFDPIEAVNDNEEVLPGIVAHLAPGHTPGCLVFVLREEEHDMIFTGDAAKNRAERVSRTADTIYDPAISAGSIELIWQLWDRRPGTVVIPGHDLPMLQNAEVTRYIGEREAAISAG